jgi:hypothetical protein
MPKTSGHRNEPWSFGLVIQCIVRIGAVADLAEQDKRRIFGELVFFKIASKEHSLP